jgi:hypothetical protein
VERILNTGVANTLAGNDTITGFGEPYKYYNPRGSGIFNSGTLNTAEGDDIITGTGGLHGIDNSGRLNTAEGNDIITGKGGLTAFTMAYLLSILVMVMTRSMAAEVGFMTSTTTDL